MTVFSNIQKCKEVIPTLLKKKWFRFPSFIGISFLITLVLFYVMAELISKESNIKKNSEKDNLVDFIRIKPRSFLDTKKRTLPKKKIKTVQAP